MALTYVEVVLITRKTMLGILDKYPAELHAVRRAVVMFVTDLRRMQNAEFQSYFKFE